MPQPSLTPTETPTLSPTVSLTEYPTTIPMIERLQGLVIDHHCLHFCWLGINPGVTSVEEAHTLLEASNKINQINVTETYIGAVWQDDTDAFLYFEKGLVKSIYLSALKILGDFTLHDFIEFLGEPDEIGVTLYQSPHCEYVLYSIYYSSRKIVVSVSYGSWNGPNSFDLIDAIALNTEFDEYLQHRYLQPPNRQSWMGYGHLQDYLPGQVLPTGPCGTSA